VVAGAALVVIGLPTTIVWSVLRLTRLLDDHARAAVPVVAALTALWLVCGASGLVVAAPYPAASRTSTGKILDELAAVRDGRLDQQVLAAELATDRYRDVPADRLLTGLRGKRVVLVFVESYGRVAIDDPTVAPPVLATLADGDRQLAAAGLQSRTGYLTSSTTGGGSWLAHATLLSGLWIDSQRRYLTLTASDRLTLTQTFQRGGWRTVGVMPGVTSAWPEGAFFHYDEIHDSADLGYAGPPFTWARVPDQYTLAQLDRFTHRGPGSSPPAMAVVPLVTSHAPWTPVPPMLDPDRLGDGAGYGPAAGGVEPPEAIGTRERTRVQADYARSISYSLTSVVSWASEEPDEDLVLIVLGDHQPAPLVTGGSSNRDVPITVITRDPAVLSRIESWDWTPGLRPAPETPVWRMDAFRDRFLDAFSAGS
ncbi:MAG TPA: CDP-alcohol phosphatidyltransferase family protein, partial [Microlunatus sp.]|nr:CDP-alcohol phosphatidyltransferase family protein [Microlunatus sp.]